MAGPIHRLLAGEDAPGRPALPAGELLQPIPLAAVALLAVNDHLLKGAGILPGALTGKLSDVAGLVFFPLLATAAVDLLLFAIARLGAPVDFSLRRWKLAAACAGTAGLMALIKLSPAGARAVADLLGGLGMPSRIVADPTDLLALPALALAYWVGRRQLAEVPLGRLEVLERRWRRGQRDVAGQLADVTRAGADAEAVSQLAEQLAAYFNGGDPGPATAALRSIRAPTAARASHP